MSTYHHGNLRASLIDTGVELARSEGPEGVSLREVARRAGVSHNAAYRHFADKDALLTEVARVGMQRLGEAMVEAVEAARPGAGATTALARLRATGKVYVGFAFAEPGLFRTAFASCPDPTDTSPALTDPDPFALLVETVDGLVAAGLVEEDRRDAMVLMCWTTVHGYATLHLDGPLRGVPGDERDAALERLLDEVEHALT